MAGLLEAVASFIVIAVVVKVMLAAMLGGLYEWRSWRFLAGLIPRSTPAEPGPRPLVQIRADARRISEAYHHEGMRFAQYEGRRQAFDRILGEASAALRIEHLLEVLPPGPERDRERARVEQALVRAGVLPTATTDGDSGSQ